MSKVKRCTRLCRVKSNKVDLNKLRIFHDVATAGGVTNAAGLRSLTRSAVSHSIAGLETELGVRLFHRIGKKLLLTEEGLALHRTFGEIRGRLEAALDEVLDPEKEVRGEIRLGLFAGFSRLHLSELIGRFLTEHPRGSARLVYGSQREVLAKLLAGRVDFTLSLKPATARYVRSTRVFEQTLVLAAGRKLFPTTPDAAQLERLPVIDYHRSDPLFLRWMQHHFARTPDPGANVRVWAGTTDVVLELVVQDVGIGVLPLDLVEPFRKRGRLRIVREEARPLRDFVWLNELESAAASQTRRAFRSILLGEVGPRA
jgi:DNA-binding transcriptional LysR family regulator